MPWGIIMMVSGVSVLIALLEKTGGMVLFTDLLARTGIAATRLNRLIAFVTGVDRDRQQHLGRRAARRFCRPPARWWTRSGEGIRLPWRFR